MTSPSGAAFQMVEPMHGLQKRGEAVRSFPVQAIALGRQVTILALSGEAALPEGVNPRGLIFAPVFQRSGSRPTGCARSRRHRARAGSGEVLAAILFTLRQVGQTGQTIAFRGPVILARSVRVPGHDRIEKPP